jgi:hypothetical protein
MTRTTTIAFFITLFFVWWMYIVTRTGTGPGLRWERVPGDMQFTVEITGLFYLVFVVIALTVLYFKQVRGHNVAASSLLLPAFIKFVATYGVAVVLGSAVGEIFCLVEERAFRKEAAAFQSTSPLDPYTHEPPMYSRRRWWPGSAQIMTTPLSGKV